MDLGYVSLNTPGDIATAQLGPELEARGFEYVGTALNQHGAVAVVTMRRDPWVARLSSP